MSKRMVGGSLLGLLGICAGGLAAQTPGQPDRASSAVSLRRVYKPGETLRYEMKGSNSGWEYRIDATDTVKRDADGFWYEEVGWSNLRSNAPMVLSPASLSFRQTLSLDGTAKYLAIPDLSKVQPLLIGPITDLLTFYSDVLIAKKQELSRVGQHAYFEHGKPNSWADGQHVVLGQDSIDFDLTLLAADEAQHTATVLVSHVPPGKPQVQLPAEWMKAPVAGGPNNFVNVEKDGGKYTAEAGKETFEVRIVLDTQCGKILSAQLDNPTAVISRECKDAELRTCGPESARTIHREISLQLLR